MRPRYAGKGKEKAANARRKTGEIAAKLTMCFELQVQRPESECILTLVRRNKQRTSLKSLLRLSVQLVTQRLGPATNTSH